MSGRTDFGATGQAQRVRPSRVTETIHAGQFRRSMLDGHLVDQLLATRLLTPSQHEAAARVLGMFDEAGFEPRQTAGYSAFGSGPGHDDDQAERHAIASFRRLLSRATDEEALSLHAMALGDPPSERGLAFLRRVLDRLADRWGF